MQVGNALINRMQPLPITKGQVPHADNITKENSLMRPSLAVRRIGRRPQPLQRA